MGWDLPSNLRGQRDRDDDQALPLPRAPGPPPPPPEQDVLSPLPVKGGFGVSPEFGAQLAQAAQLRGLIEPAQPRGGFGLQASDDYAQQLARNTQARSANAGAAGSAAAFDLGSVPTSPIAGTSGPVAMGWGSIPNGGDDAAPGSAVAAVGPAGATRGGRRVVAGLADVDPTHGDSDLRQIASGAGGAPGTGIPGLDPRVTQHLLANYPEAMSGAGEELVHSGRRYGTGGHSDQGAGVRQPPEDELREAQRRSAMLEALGTLTGTHIDTEAPVRNLMERRQLASSEAAKDPTSPQSRQFQSMLKAVMPDLAGRLGADLEHVPASYQDQLWKLADVTAQGGLRRDQFQQGQAEKKREFEIRDKEAQARLEEGRGQHAFQRNLMTSRQDEQNQDRDDKALGQMDKELGDTGATLDLVRQLKGVLRNPDGTLKHRVPGINALDTGARVGSTLANAINEHLPEAAGGILADVAGGPEARHNRRLQTWLQERVRKVLGEGARVTEAEQQRLESLAGKNSWSTEDADDALKIVESQSRAKVRQAKAAHPRAAKHAAELHPEYADQPTAAPSSTPAAKPAPDEMVRAVTPTGEHIQLPRSKVAGLLADGGRLR